MRVGFNPNKDKVIIESDYFHQIIIPVYIPNQREYFLNSLQILSLCLESLFRTCHSHTFISVIDNGSCEEVYKYLIKLKREQKIHELIHTSNIGKLNAIFKGLAGHKFRLITITDADVLFINGWQESTYTIFDNFPRAGAVSPVPSSKMFNYYTSNILGANFFSSALKFTKVKNPAAMMAFAKSIGNDEFYNDVHLEKYLTIEKSKIVAVVGAGHFVCTYSRNVFEKVRNNYSEFQMGGKSEEYFLDRSVIDIGLWRLSTQDNFAYHLGNVYEEWMSTSINNLFDNKQTDGQFYPKIHKTNKMKISWSFFEYLMSKKIVRRFFLTQKGLNRNQAQVY